MPEIHSTTPHDRVVATTAALTQIHAGMEAIRLAHSNLKTLRLFDAKHLTDLADQLKDYRRQQQILEDEIAELKDAADLVETPTYAAGVRHGINVAIDQIRAEGKRYGAASPGTSSAALHHLADRMTARLSEDFGLPDLIAEDAAAEARVDTLREAAEIAVNVVKESHSTRSSPTCAHAAQLIADALRAMADEAEDVADPPPAIPAGSPAAACGLAEACPARTPPIAEENAPPPTTPESIPDPAPAPAGRQTAAGVWAEAAAMAAEDADRALAYANQFPPEYKASEGFVRSLAQADALHGLEQRFRDQQRKADQ